MIDILKNDTEAVRVSAHRGYMSEYPENTLLSFKKALDQRVDMIEFDLRFSKDNTLMIIHDETIDRTTNGFGKVRDFTVTELQDFTIKIEKELEIEEKVNIPTLHEFCELLKLYPPVLLNVEIKPSEDAKEVADAAIEVLKKYNLLTRCVFASFDASIVSYISRVYGLKTQGFLGELMLNFVAGPDGTYSDMWAAGIPMKLLSKEIVSDFNNKGILPWCYCPDQTEEVLYALECGAYLMTCNNPIPALRVRDSQYKK